MTDDTTDDVEQSSISMKLEALAADTPEEEIHQRAALKKDGSPVMKDGKPMELSYVTARFVQDRLDSVMGPQNWQNNFESLPSGAVRCGISIRIPDLDTWVTKWDVGVPSSIEKDKGAHSDAFKRAGVMWGIARDLYDERDEDRAPVEVVQPASNTPAIATPVRQQVEGPQSVSIETYDEPSNDLPAAGPNGWLCPIHEDARVVPAGISKKTGKPYGAFRACPVAGCSEKEPFPAR
jgi:hypothetical protein